MRCCDVEYDSSNLDFRNLPPRFDIEVSSKECLSEIVFDRVPSDKSISQRAIILNSLGNGRSTVYNALESDDISNCISALKKMGVDIEWQGSNVAINGVGLDGLRPPTEKLYMGNSATSTRLIMAVVAGHSFASEITGNSLLSERPMAWAVSPLIKMGAKVFFKGKVNQLPIMIEGKHPLIATEIDATVASAQEKSVVLFAGMFARGTTVYRQFCQSRDHTERMMKHLGLQICIEGETTKIDGMMSYRGKDIYVPGDISSAAFLATAGIIRKDNSPRRVIIKNVGINHTRDGFFKILKKIGIKIMYSNEHSSFGEPIADILCEKNEDLRNVDIEGKENVQSLVDEVPLLAIIAACSSGKTKFIDCQELKDKDTNRIETTAKIIRAFSGTVETSKFGLSVIGNNSLKAARVNSYGDHRIAMTAAVLASSIVETSYIENFECIRVSYPNFLKDLSRFANIKVIPRK
jgi:3-phosphoshikimate 1-carboxyvinyltransferase